MDENTQNQLIELNNQFYQNFARNFSETRQRLQPGITRVLGRLPVDINLLDLGCGNGELACVLIRRGYKGRYVGIDSSQVMLTIAASAILDCKLPGSNLDIEFIQADLSSLKWSLMLTESSFDSVFAFAVLHHLPGRELRDRVIKDIQGLLSPGGRFVHSGWQFLNSKRLRERIQPWESIGICEESVEAGDYLLDWRRGGTGLRYVHHFNETELAQLAADNGFRIKETFLSDGEGGNLGLYQVWELKLSPSHKSIV